jgi:branched-subunit amino acid ABC-type transport system permease component
MDQVLVTETIQTLVPALKILAATPLTLLTTVSAGLFQDTVWYCNLEENKIISLSIASILFFFSFINTIRERFNKRTFNCDFTFSLGVPVSFSIGLVYSVTDQRSIV